MKHWRPIIVGTIILVLCLLPASELSKINIGLSFTDVIVHFLMFLTFAIALYLDSLKMGTKQHTGSSLWKRVFLICLLFGTATELLQHWVTILNRTGSFVDLLFDALGSIAGISVMMIIKQKPGSAN